MRGWLRDLPIRRKLVVVITATTAAALLVASAALLILDVRGYHERMRDDLRSLSSIVADNTTAALSFNDRPTATEVLAALDANSEVQSAAIYDRQGRLFAEYRSPAAPAVPPSPGPDGLHAPGATLEIVQPIVLHGDRIGSLFMSAGLGLLHERLRMRTITVGLVLLAAVLVALLLSSWLQRLVADPLLDLAATARDITERQDYTRRAAPRGRDEIGLLVTAFNDMLSQIGRRDAELLAAKNELEERVAERTARLRDELAERRRAEETLERRNRELVEVNRELDDFAYIASHDLKEPLRGIHNYAGFLLEDQAGRLDEDAQAKLQTLVRLSRRMEQLIDSLLHYSRLGRLDLVLEPVDTRAVVDEVLDRLGILLRERAVEVRISGRLPQVPADRVRLGEVFANLITNSVKYNDKPRRWIEIGTVHVASVNGPAENGGGTDEYTFYVRDNGIGIPERHLETVFRIFKRLHGRDEFGGGTGAGLTIVRKIVERHQGRVWIESTPGEGTTVFFTLQKGAPRG